MIFYYIIVDSLFLFYILISMFSDGFLKNAKDISIYDTKVTAEYSEQLLTLLTCDYSKNNGRFAIVVKKASKVNN